MKYTEKTIKKYVIATLDNPTKYIRSMGHGEYLIVDDIEKASKTMGRKVAESLLNYFYHDTGTDMEFVIVPVTITYVFDDSDIEGWYKYYPF